MELNHKLPSNIIVTEQCGYWIPNKVLKPKEYDRYDETEGKLTLQLKVQIMVVSDINLTIMTVFFRGFGPKEGNNQSLRLL